MNSIAIIKTGTANVASVAAAFERLRLNPRMVESPSQIANDEGVVLPGVGSFATAMLELRKQGFVEYLIDRINNGRPTLAICLGLQLLCKSSEESTECDGLGIIDAVVKRFRGDLLVPQLGWNHVDASFSGGALQSGFAYFANSYYLDQQPAGWNVATTSYGSNFVSAIEREAVLACQFHPELSAEFGQSLLKNWVAVSRAYEVPIC